MKLRKREVAAGLLVLASCVSRVAFAETQVTSIEFKSLADSSEIQIRGAGAISYEVSENAADKQVVLDLKDAKLSKYATRKLDTSSFNSPVTLISPYQLQEPANTARVVIQLRENVSPNVTQDGNLIRVSIPAAPGAQAGVDQPPGEGPSAPPAAEAPAAEAPAGKSASAGAKSNLDQFIDAQQTKRFIGRPITLQLRDAEVGDVFRLIADASGFNIVLGDDVKGKTTLSLVDVPWDQALDVILSSQKLGAERNGNVLRVVTLKTLTEEKQEQLRAKRAADASTPRVTRVFPISFANLNDLRDTLSKLVSESSAPAGPRDPDAVAMVLADSRTNSLIVRDTPERVERVRKLLEVLDTQTPQVLIEAKIIEASEQLTRKIGGGISVSKSFFGDNSLTGSVSSGGLASGISFGVTPSTSSLAANLAMLESESKLKVVASPKTVVMDKETAKILQSQPVLTAIAVTTTGSSTGTVIPTAQLSSANLSLDVTPTVTNEGSVLLALTVTRDIPFPVGGTSAVANRNLKTKVLVDSGSTLVIGGIYTNTTNDDDTGVPFLKDLPLLGYLFSEKTHGTSRTELFIFVTPRILNPKEAGLTASAS